MNDPYEVLGITRYATDDEVKRAYRELSRKYHPDANAGNPLADLAEEKFKEVQDAYNTIMDMRAHGGQYYGEQNYDQGYQQGYYQDNRQQYRQYSSGYGRQPVPSGNSCMNDLCTLFICDSLCECMGGDLCRCI